MQGTASMTSRQRVRATLDFKMPDRVGIADEFDGKAIISWREEGKLPQGVSAEEYFDFDIRLFGFNQDFRIGEKNIDLQLRLEHPFTGESIKEHYESARQKEKFLVLSCVEPFEHIAGTIGKEMLLSLMAEDADKASRLFSQSLEQTLGICQALFDKGYSFDGAWLWGDLAYGKGLLFSTDYYNAFLFDLHREMCDFFAKNGMPVIFHSDGNVSELIPPLIEAGVRAIEPLESDTGMDVGWIKKEYGKYIVLFGGIDEKMFSGRTSAEKEIRTKFKTLMRGGGYIYHADSPILDDIAFDDYAHVLRVVKEAGTYITGRDR